MNPLHLSPLSGTQSTASESPNFASVVENKTESAARAALTQPVGRDLGHILVRGNPPVSDSDEDDEMDSISESVDNDFPLPRLSPHIDDDEGDRNDNTPQNITSSISVEGAHYAPPLTSIEYEKILTPEKILEQLKKIEKQIDNLDQSIEGVFTKATDIVKKKKIQSVIDLPANKRIKLENELLDKGERIINRQRYLEKCLKGVDPKLPDNDPVKMEINRLGGELREKLAASKETVKENLKFYGNIRLFHFLEMIAKILRQLNESIRAINSIR